MRDKNHIQKYLKQTSKQLTAMAEKLQRSEVLRNPVVASSTLNQDFLIYPRSFFEIRNLIVISKWTREDLAWEIRLDLEEKEFNFNYRQKAEIAFLLQLNKYELLSYLWCLDEASRSKFFGLLFDNKLFPKIKRVTHRGVKKPVFRKGYNDKGSLSPSDHKVSDLDRDVLYNELLLFKKMTHTLQDELVLILAKTLLLRAKSNILEISKILVGKENFREGNEEQLFQGYMRQKPFPPISLSRGILKSGTYKFNEKRRSLDEI